MNLELRKQVARLFAALEYGEQLAFSCAVFQSGSALSDPRSKRFLRVQAMQEKAHAAFFRTAADWLDSRQGNAVPVAMVAFGARLKAAMARNDYIDLLVGSQIVLEGFGEQILNRLNAGMDRRHIGFVWQRKRILRQERSHYAFGLRALETQLDLCSAQLDQARDLTHEYLCILQHILLEMQEVFNALEESAEGYMVDLITALPHWLRPDSHDFHYYSRSG